MPNRTDTLRDPTASYWLKDALKASASRDILDACWDAERLAAILRAELNQVLGAGHSASPFVSVRQVCTNNAFAYDDDLTPDIESHLAMKSAGLL